jgi:aminoglycoside phosphotransferase (APT) family kinase protein
MIAVNDQVNTEFPINYISSDNSFANPDNPEEIAATLLEYLRRRWRMNRLSFRAAPEAIPHGWETYTYCFQIKSCPGLPASFSNPLILRIYASPVGLSNARREWVAENYLAQTGFPVVTCLFLEEDSRFFGGPFLISIREEGEVFPDYLYHHRWRILRLPRKMGCLHADLHQIPVSEKMIRTTPFLERRLDEMNRLIRQYDLTELAPGYRWLVRHRPTDQATLSILHLDFHPLNLLYGSSRGFTVLDWSQVDVGDRHADVAVTKMFLDCMQVDRPTWWQRFNFWGGRLLLRHGYLAAYQRRFPLDTSLLGYYSAWASLGRLCTYCSWLRAGPAAFGSKPASLGKITQSHVDRFCQYFEEHTGVGVSIPIHKFSRTPGLPSESTVASQAIPV